MKLLHTADWHAAKPLHGRSRVDEHESVLAEIVEIARAERIDLALVAGDLFDASSPSPEAERIVYRALLQLSEVAPVMIVPGNHDNERRLDAIAPLFRISNVTIQPFVSGTGPLELVTSSGERALVAALPWLSQRYIVKADQLMAKDAAELTGHYSERLRRIIATLTEGFSEDAVNIVLGHVTIAGAEPGGGERTAQTIFDYWIDASAFPAGAHYVGLGHIHKSQAMPGPCPIHYSGSPLQLDFSDQVEDKCVLVVEASPKTPAVVTERPLKSGRRLRTLRGTLEHLETLAGETGDDYLRVLLQEPRRAGLGDEVRSLFPNAVKVIIDAVEARPEKRAPDRSGLSPRDLFSSYLAERDTKDDRLLELFQRLYEECA